MPDWLFVTGKWLLLHQSINRGGLIMNLVCCSFFQSSKPPLLLLLRRQNGSGMRNYIWDPVVYHKSGAIG
jgi:hypothetical protein